MGTRQSILSEIARFLALTSMSEHRFGMNSVQDVAFVRRLRSGDSVTLKRIELAETYMATVRGGLAAQARANEPEAAE